MFVRKLTSSALEAARDRSGIKRKNEKQKEEVKGKKKKKMKMMIPGDVVKGLNEVDMDILKKELESRLAEIQKEEMEERNKKRKRKLAQPSEEELKEQQRKLFEAANKAMVMRGALPPSLT